MNNFLLEPISFIGFSTVLAGFEAGVGPAALMGGVLAVVNKTLTVKPIVKDMLGKYMTSKGFEAPYIEQVSQIVNIGLACLIAGSISTFCGVVQLPLIKTFGLMVATYTFKLGIDFIVNRIKDFDEKQIQDKKELLHGAGELLKGTDSLLEKSKGLSQSSKDAMKDLNELFNPSGIKAGTVIQPGHTQKKKKTKTVIDAKGNITTVEE